MTANAANTFWIFALSLVLTWGIFAGMKSCSEENTSHARFDPTTAARMYLPVTSDTTKTPLTKKDSVDIQNRYLRTWNDSVRLSPFNDWLRSGHIYSPADYDKFQQILQAYISECYQKDASKLFKH